MLDDSTWEQPLVIYTRARLDRKDSNLSLSNNHIYLHPSLIHSCLSLVKAIRPHFLS